MVFGEPTTLVATGVQPGHRSLLLVSLEPPIEAYRTQTPVLPPTAALLPVEQTGDDRVTGTGAWPPGLFSDTSVYFQLWTLDDSGSAMSEASNVLEAITP